MVFDFLAIEAVRHIRPGFGVKTVQLEERGAREWDALVCGAEDDVGLGDGWVGG